MPGLIIEKAEETWVPPKKSISRLSVPTSFPDRMEGPMAWTGSDLDDGKQYTETLSKDEVQEIEEALDHFKGLNLESSLLSRETFPLSHQLSSRLQSISTALHLGRGFSVVRGIDPARYNDEDNILIFAGIASHVANERSNLRHICDRSTDKNKSPDQLRPPELDVKMTFHTDLNAGDILALYAQNVSMSGGAQSVASFWKVYNDLAVEAPDVLHTLAQDWRFEVAWSDRSEVINRPLMHYEDGKLMFSFAKAFLVGSPWDQRLPEAPPLSAAQERAIAILEDKFEQHRLTLSQKRGDMLFVNNLSILHARESFVDNPRIGRTRHMVNVMLRDPVRAWKQPLDVFKYSDARFQGPTARAMVTLPQFDAHLKKLQIAGIADPKAHD